MAWKFEKTCPNCGSHLILREGRYGEFLACPRFPECKHSEPVGDTENLYQPPSPFCEKCNHTGLLPFVKNGKVIPFAWLDCECRMRQTEHYHKFSPTDIDFPVSWDFHRMYSVKNGLPDPDVNETPPEVPPVETPKAQIVYQFVTKPMPMPDRAKAAQRVRQVREKLDAENNNRTDITDRLFTQLR